MRTLCDAYYEEDESHERAFLDISQNKPQVIGDKTAWDTAVILRLRGTQAIYEMKKKLAVKVKFIHVVRNPFDNIATFVLRHRDIQARTADPNVKVRTYKSRVEGKQ